MAITTALKEYMHSSDFCKELVLQYERYEILSEAGLRTAIANLLRVKLQLLGELAEDYRVACETHLKDVNVVPDILIWKKKHPRIWIELKDTRRFDPKKAEADWLKLQDFCKLYPSVKAGYLIYVARYDGVFPIRRDRQTIRYWPIKIALEHHISDFTRWETEYSRRAHCEPPQPATKSALARPKAYLST